MNISFALLNEWQINVKCFCLFEMLFIRLFCLTLQRVEELYC